MRNDLFLTFAFVFVSQTSATAEDAKKPKENDTVAIKSGGAEESAGDSEDTGSGGTDSDEDKENRPEDAGKDRESGGEDDTPELEQANSSDEEENKDGVLAKRDDNDNDKDWDEDDSLDTGRDGIPDVKSKFSHPVHCPYFPEVRCHGGFNN